MSVGVVLLNPKTPFNVGAAIRACSTYDVKTLRWTGKRITTAEASRKAGSELKGRANRPRLPREERMKDYANVDWREAPEDVVSTLTRERGFVPVAVEVRDGAESLHDFVHPEDALYVFGPEDGSVSRSVLAVCYRFVRIPTVHRTPLNLAAAVNVVLYDRYAKELRREPVEDRETSLYRLLAEVRA